jgi:hypothetical protein
VSETSPGFRHLHAVPDIAERAREFSAPELARLPDDVWAARHADYVPSRTPSPELAAFAAWQLAAARADRADVAERTAALDRRRAIRLVDDDTLGDEL